MEKTKVRLRNGYTVPVKRVLVAMQYFSAMGRPSARRKITLRLRLFDTERFCSRVKKGARTFPRVALRRCPPSTTGVWTALVLKAVRHTPFALPDGSGALPRSWFGACAVSGCRQARCSDLRHRSPIVFDAMLDMLVGSLGVWWGLMTLLGVSSLTWPRPDAGPGAALSRLRSQACTTMVFET